MLRSSPSSLSDSKAAAFHTKWDACTRTTSVTGLADRFSDFQMSLTFVISDGPRSLCEAAAAVAQLGSVKPGRRPSRTRGFLLGSQGYPGGHVVLVKKMFRASHFEGFRGGCQTGDPPAPHGLCRTQWGLCLPVPHTGRRVQWGRYMAGEVRPWAAGGTSGEEPRP